MSAIFSKILAFILSILAFFGINIGGTVTGPTEPTEVTDAISWYVDDDVLVFTMTANPSTGYCWTENVTGVAVSFKSEEIKYPEREIPITGLPGTEYMYFDVVAPGTAEITFTYSRVFENTAPITQQTIIVTVGTDMSVTCTAK